ncbi:protein hinderin isoform X2 [Lampris incognitus]|uniref:protein hinderin isoform X2 n=1 Tax=Lampris incognitus TaxID=2546036 RepID=UPI0024B4B708|nr:protein hinderin isoform X2 [Lampris incognitus]
MAASAGKRPGPGIFWTNDELSGKVTFPTSFKPGPESTSNAGARGARMRAKHSCESTTKVPLSKGDTEQVQLQSGPSVMNTKVKSMLHPDFARTMECTPSSATNGFLPMSQAVSVTSKAQSQACLKDLCPEDKRRIANLIEELARVSEEKEESVQRLKDEQETFERKIQQLEQQNLLIVQERGSLQQQYRECQELLGLYQQYLSQQQEKLNQSIAQLSQPPSHSKVSRNEGVNSRMSTSKANVYALDGSYLGLATIQTCTSQGHQKAGGRKGTTTAFNDNTSLTTTTPSCSFSSESECTPMRGPMPKQHRGKKAGREDPHSQSHARCEHDPNNSYRTQPRRTDNDPCLENGHRGRTDQHEFERLPSGDVIHPEAKEALTTPLLGNENWEEKRHQLLLQKMQLEVERERLQVRLAEQEERLLRQNLQLRQSRLDYNRFQQTAQAELSSSVIRDGPPQQEGQSDRQPLPSECEDAALFPIEQRLCEELSQTSSNHPHTGIHTQEAPQRSKRDMATSPLMSLPSLGKPISVPVIPRTPEARLDSSLVELLEAFSPASGSVQRKHSLQRRKMPLNAYRQGHRALAPPAMPCSLSPQQDLEETRMLEDIFFIC